MNRVTNTRRKEGIVTRRARGEYAEPCGGGVAWRRATRSVRSWASTVARPGCIARSPSRASGEGPVRQTRRRGRRPVYGPALVPVIERLWEISDRPCDTLLVPVPESPEPGRPFVASLAGCRGKS
jgi:hypothetical protein